MKTQFKILSIDAWADGEGWTWNQWYNAGKTEKIPDTVEEFLEILDSNGYDCLTRKGWELDDDGYNVVLIASDTLKPYFAIEYGSEE